MTRHSSHISHSILSCILVMQGRIRTSLSAPRKALYNFSVRIPLNDGKKLSHHSSETPQEIARFSYSTTREQPHISRNLGEIREYLSSKKTYCLMVLSSLIPLLL